jgi:hypothetical protein
MVMCCDEVAAVVMLDGVVMLLVWCCCSWSAGVLGRANPHSVIFLYHHWFPGGLTPLSMHLMSELLLACLPVSAGLGIFLGAMVISLNDLMIINNGICFFDCHLVITPWLCFYHVFGCRYQKEKK